MAWFDDESLLTYVATFDNPKKASEEANRAARKGWMPQGTATTDGHVNVGRTTLKVLTLGLPFLVTGASRSQGKITLTFVRTPEWLSAKEARDGAKASASEARERAKREAQSAKRAADAQDTAQRRHEPSVAVSSTWIVGHVSAETAWYQKPDIFAKPAGTLPPGMPVEIRSTQGTFAWIQPRSGPTCWIRRAAITEGLARNDEQEPAAIAANAPVLPPAAITVAEPAPTDAELSEKLPSQSTERPASAPSPERDNRVAATFCGRCGQKRTSEGDQFCRSCGAEL